MFAWDFKGFPSIFPWIIMDPSFHPVPSIPEIDETVRYFHALADTMQMSQECRPNFKRNSAGKPNQRKAQELIMLMYIQ